MLTPQDIYNRAERKYRDVLRLWLAGEEFIPQEYPVGSVSKQLAERRQQIEALQNNSKDSLGFGYKLVLKTVNSRTLGTQTVPDRVVIHTLDDYLKLLRKRTEFNHFVADVRVIRQKFPQLESWMQARPQAIIEYHGKWNDLLLVCTYFVEHPRPNMYIRELPIQVHTKFIEAHKTILGELFDTLLPEWAINQTETEFTTRYGLKDKPTLVRVRLLESQLIHRYGLWIDDLTLPVTQLNHVLADHIQPRLVIIVENLINFLTLPPLIGAVGILGAGFAVHVLRDVTWLHQCQIIYWGDLDAHGFEMLSDVRNLFPQTRSIMMDQHTLDTFQQYVSQGKRSRTARFEHLTPAELSVAQTVFTHDLRLEQEHIPHTYALTYFEHINLNNL